MCMFCAAIPAALALGVNAQARQRQQKSQAEEKGEQPPRPGLPAGPATAVVVAGLVISSIIYHSQ